MAQVYVDDKTKKKLDELADKEHRALNDEIEFLIDSRLSRLKELGKK